MNNFEKAQNPNTPPEILEELSKDSDLGVRCWVTRNPNTPSEILEKLSKDSDWSVRCWVARNPNTPTKTFIQLVQDKNEVVVGAVKANSSCPEGIKLWLANGGFAGMSLEEFMEAVNG